MHDNSQSIIVVCAVLCNKAHHPSLNTLHVEDEGNVDDEYR